jgi:predicted DNA-binding mobile mystery protein A
MNRKIARQALETRLRAIRRVAPSLTPPSGGWLKAVRTALGMSGRQFAARLEVSPPTANGIEKSESRGTATLDTLRRAAAALDCTLVYALVPNGDLETIVQQRARSLARERLRRVSNTMALENQEVPGASSEREVARLAEEILTSEPLALWARS